MQAPLLLIGCADPVQGPRELVRRFQALGFIVEPVKREDVPDHLERVATLGEERPDAVLLAPESERESRRLAYNAAIAEEAHTLIARIRDLPDHFCFLGNVRAKTIPIVLAAFGDDRLFYSAYATRSGPRFKWFDVCRDTRPRVLDALVITAIREWRQSLVEQLQYFGYAIVRDATGQYRVGHALLRPRRENDMLCAGASLRRSGFYILKSDALDDLPSYQGLERVLNTFRAIAAVQGVQPETVLQRFFDAHPHLLARGRFGTQHSKPILPRPGRAPWKPDYVQEPRPLSQVHTAWSITDLKLPDVDPLQSRRAFHRGLSSKIHKAIDQLNDYRDLLRTKDPRVVEHLIRQFGTVPIRPNRAVVIGRRPGHSEEVALMQRRVRALGVGVEVITYDDVLDAEARRILIQANLGANL